MVSADPIGMHDWQSTAYVRQWIDAQREEERAILLRKLVYLIPFDADAEIRVLDVGAGYGALAALVLENFPRARVVLHDYSEPMLAEARSRLAAYSDSLGYVGGDLMGPAWTAAISGRFQAVVSSIAIHNVRFPDRIRAIYGEVLPLLAPGGCFLNFDQVSPAGDLVAGAERHARLMERRRRLYAQSGEWSSLAQVASSAAASGRGGAAAAAAASEAGERISSQEPATLMNQMRWLREAGFQEVECFWRDGRRAIIGAFLSR